MGYQPPIIALLSKTGGQDSWDFIINQLLGIFTDPVFLASMGVAGVSAFLLGGGYVVTYVFPILVLLVLANIFVFPISYIWQATLPTEIQTLVTAWFNFLLILGAVEFVRGGSL